MNNGVHVTKIWEEKNEVVVLKTGFLYYRI